MTETNEYMAKISQQIGAEKKRNPKKLEASRHCWEGQTDFEWWKVVSKLSKYKQFRKGLGLIFTKDNRVRRESVEHEPARREAGAGE